MVNEIYSISPVLGPSVDYESIDALECDSLSEQQPTTSKQTRKLTENRERSCDGKIDQDKFQLPTYFGHVINSKLDKKKALDHNEENVVCRLICNAIAQFSPAPKADCYLFVISKMNEKFPSIFEGLQGIDTNTVKVYLSLIIYICVL